jgi:hypothetical protein
LASVGFVLFKTFTAFVTGFAEKPRSALPPAFTVVQFRQHIAAEIGYRRRQTASTPIFPRADLRGERFCPNQSVAAPAGAPAEASDSRVGFLSPIAP